MALQALLKKHRFSQNPFHHFMAEDEGEQLKEWFIPPPFLRTILGDSGRGDSRFEPVSNVIFGKPGSGKTAIRLMMEKEIFKNAIDDLVVRYEEFSDVLSCEKPGSLQAHVEEILRCSTIGLLGFWHQCGKSYADLSTSAKKELAGLTSHFYETLDDNTKEVYAGNLPFHHRVYAIAKERKKTVIDLYNATISTMKLEKISPTDWNPNSCAQGQHNPFLRLQKFWSLAKSIGVKYVWILVDKVDETHGIKSGIEIYHCMAELLLSQRIIEFRDEGKQVLCFKFFLTRPQELLPMLKERGFRTDRIKIEAIEWRRRDLEAALHKRLSYFSSGRVINFDQICEPSYQGTHDRLLDECGLRPRTLFRMAHEILNVFDTTAKEDAEKIDRHSIDEGIKKGLTAIYG